MSFEDELDKKINRMVKSAIAEVLHTADFHEAFHKPQQVQRDVPLQSKSKRYREIWRDRELQNFRDAFKIFIKGRIRGHRRNPEAIIWAIELVIKDYKKEGFK